MMIILYNAWWLYYVIDTGYVTMDQKINDNDLKGFKGCLKTK